MSVYLLLKEKNIRLVLSDGKEEIAEKHWVDRNDLLERFFPALDDLLRENDVVFDEIEQFLLETEIPQGYTTARIARTVVKTLNFARQKEV